MFAAHWRPIPPLYRKPSETFPLCQRRFQPASALAPKRLELGCPSSFPQAVIPQARRAPDPSPGARRHSFRGRAKLGNPLVVPSSFLMRAQGLPDRVRATRLDAPSRAALAEGVLLSSSDSSVPTRAVPPRPAPPRAAMGLAAEGLACRRGERLLFERIGFTLPAGGLLRLVGPNGSGKSSLLRLLAGLMPPAAGSVRWGGEPVGADMAAHHRRLRFLAHLDGVKPALTVAENLAFWARLLAAPAGAVDAALDAFDLARIGDLPARFLSAGQRRRVALARLPLAPADLWLLDEPTTSLDSDGSERLLVQIRAHRARGGLAVVATHDRLPFDPTQELRLPAGELVLFGA